MLERRWVLLEEWRDKQNIIIVATNDAGRFRRKTANRAFSVLSLSFVLKLGM